MLCDLQHGMLSAARGRTVAAGNVVWSVGDAMALPFADGTFDAALVATVLGEVPDRAACVAELCRVVRAGGVVTVAETRRDSDFIGRAELEALFTGAGFRLLGCRGPGWEYTARFT
jgi:ubiquinone/menaquinone biosynthesis C-methylase UbiE